MEISLKRLKMHSNNNEKKESRLIIFVFLFFSQAFNTTSSEPFTCPLPCFCISHGNIVHCSKKELSSIPKDISSLSIQLYFNNNPFTSPHLTKQNFSTFPAVEHLYLSECGIRSIEPGTFQDLHKLKWLDLSKNFIAALLPWVFSHSRLDHLFLNGNRGLRLNEDSLKGLQTKGLYLHDCQLPSFQSSVISPLRQSLKFLWLNNNHIHHLHSNLLDPFSHLMHLRLGNNPLWCNCQLQWLKGFFDANREVFKGAPPPYCSNFESNFPDVKSTMFKCKAPSFGNAEIHFSSSSATLRCQSSGDPTPVLYWVEPSGKTTKFEAEVREEMVGFRRKKKHKKEKRSDGTSYKLPSNQASLIVSNSSFPPDNYSPSHLGMFICIAKNSAGNSTLTFKLTWPPPSSSASFSSSSSLQSILNSQAIRPSNNKNKNKNIDDDIYDNTHHDAHNNQKTHNNAHNDNYTVLKVSLSGEQERMFSLWEMVVAVIGTHLATLILCLCLAPLLLACRWKKGFKLKERLNDNGGVWVKESCAKVGENPFPTHHHSNHHLSSASSSSDKSDIYSRPLENLVAMPTHYH